MKKIRLFSLAVSVFCALTSAFLLSIGSPGLGALNLGLAAVNFSFVCILKDS